MPTTQTGQNILIVDDNPHNLHLLADILTSQGYRVRPASIGPRALTTVQTEPPDLILLDIMMPEMDGYEVCRRLKADKQTRDIPIIFISALEQPIDIVTAFMVGGVDYITKPFQFEEMLARVHTHLSLRETRQKLQEKNAQLKQQNADLDAFAHTVAHDLKGPITSLIGSLTFVHQYAAPVLEDDIEELLQISVQSGYKMVHIINELLLLASVREGEVDMQPLNMAEIVLQAKERLTSMIEEYNADIVILGDWPPAVGYAPWIEEVWTNYLSNGLKYGGRPPRLELGADRQADGTVLFWVQDNGPGLTPEAQAKLFTEFTRLDKIRAEGHGLGLSIVRRIMDKLGGDVGVESEPGKGSQFYFTLKAPEMLKS